MLSYSVSMAANEYPADLPNWAKQYVAIIPVVNAQPNGAATYAGTVAFSYRWQTMINYRDY